MREAALVIVSCLAVCGLADDAAKPSAPKCVTAEEWTRQVDETAKIATKGDRAIALKKLAAGTLIERHGKIRDFVKDVDHAEILAVVVCGIYGGASDKRFDVGINDVETISKWRRWDRLGWNERARVTDSGEITFEVATPLAQCTRTPNPGFQPPSQGKATANVDTFSEWLKQFGRAAYEGNYSAASDLWVTGAATTWILPALTHKQSDGSIVVHLQIDGNWEKWIDEPTGKYTKRGDPIMHSVLAGRWGFTKWADLPFVTEDPQAIALMTDQTALDVAVDLPADGADAAIRKSPFRATIHPWKIKGKK